jgi:hypothetical protein
MNLFLFPWEIGFLLIPLGLILAVANVFVRSPRNARVFRMVSAGCVSAGLLLLVIAFALRIPLDTTGGPVQTSATAVTPLQSRVYTAAPANDILREAVLAAEAQQSWFRRWQVVRRDQTPVSGGQMQVSIAGWAWNDTLVATIRPEAQGVQVDVSARSPAGFLALGAPRRHVAQFLAALDARVIALGH